LYAEVYDIDNLVRRTGAVKPSRPVRDYTFDCYITAGRVYPQAYTVGLFGGRKLLVVRPLTIWAYYRPTVSLDSACAVQLSWLDLLFSRDLAGLNTPFLALHATR